MKLKTESKRDSASLHLQASSLFEIDRFRIRNLLFRVICLLCAISCTRAQAQFLGFTAGQIVTKSFSITATNAPQTLALPNFGQVAHSIQYQWQSASPCGFVLDGSQDGTNWSTIAAGTSSTSSNNLYTYANGYFSQERLKINPNSATCTGSKLVGVYAGYQMPLPLIPVTSTSRIGNIASPVAGNTNYGTPVLLSAFQCFNSDPTNTTYLQLFDSATSPTLGESVIYEMGIAPLSSFSFPAAVFFVISNRLWLGAATAPGGNVAAATPIVCNVQLSFTGPFYPLNPSSP